MMNAPHCPYTAMWLFNHMTSGERNKFPAFSKRMKMKITVTGRIWRK